MERGSTVRAAATCAVLVLLLLGVGAVKVVPGARAAATDTLSVTVGDQFAFVLSADEVTPGDTVSVTITQVGSTDHTFTLLDARNFTFNWSASSSDSVAHIEAFLAAHPPLVNVSIPGTQSTIGPVTFVAPPFGLYEYLCLASGHFAAGMWGILGSGEHGGAASVDTGPGIAVFLIVGGIAGLVVVTLVLAFVVGKRRGAVHEMPPERLGYAEPPPPAVRK